MTFLQKKKKKSILKYIIQSIVSVMEAYFVDSCGNNKSRNMDRRKGLRSLEFIVVELVRKLDEKCVK